MAKAFDIDELTPTERLDLIERLWESFAGEEVPVSDAQRQELERRLDTLDGWTAAAPASKSNHPRWRL
jgi:putative addiction module component (TIGR02574 family)